MSPCPSAHDPPRPSRACSSARQCLSHLSRTLLSLPLLLAVGCTGGSPGAAGGDGDARVATPEGADIRVVTVVGGLEHPWSMAFLPDGDVLITERPGRLRIVRNGNLLPDPVQGTPEVQARGQGGLLDVQIHPDFAANRWVYLTYAKPVPGGATTALFRGRLEGDRLMDGADLFVAMPPSERRQHFGSRLAFDGKGHLFMTIGDRGDRASAQDRSNHHGTVLRLREDGSVPPDNPFVGQPDVRPEIWSWGHRNPQGLAFHPITGELWSTEHGPQGGDELNRILPGRNYGWPVVTFGREYGPLRQRISDVTEREGLESPVTEWTPSIGASGLAFYTGARIPTWTGDLFAGGLAQAHVVRIILEGNAVAGEEKLLVDDGRRIRDVRDGPDGLLYLLVDAPDAPLIRLEPLR